MFGNLLAPEHLLIVLAVILLMFGGKKIPELASGLGKGVREFKNGVSGGHEPATPAVTAPAATPAVAAEPAGRTVETISVAPAEPKRLIG